MKSFLFGERCCVEACSFAVLLGRFQDRTLDMNTRLGALKLYRRHLTEQYSDRCAFWSLKDISGDVSSRTITMITDGADQVTGQSMYVSFLGDYRHWFLGRLGFSNLRRQSIWSREIHSLDLHTAHLSCTEQSWKSTEFGHLGQSFDWQFWKRQPFMGPAWSGNWLQQLWMTWWSNAVWSRWLNQTQLCWSVIILSKNSKIQCVSWELPIGSTNAGWGC